MRLISKYLQCICVNFLALAANNSFVLFNYHYSILVFKRLHPFRMVCHISHDGILQKTLI